MKIESDEFIKFIDPNLKEFQHAAEIVARTKNVEIVVDGNEKYYPSGLPYLYFSVLIYKYDCFTYTNYEDIRKIRVDMYIPKYINSGDTLNETEKITMINLLKSPDKFHNLPTAWDGIIKSYNDINNYRKWNKIPYNFPMPDYSKL